MDKEPRQVCEQLQESSNSEVKFSADFWRKCDVESMLPTSMNTPIWSCSKLSSWWYRINFTVQTRPSQITMKLNNSIFATEHIQIDAGLPLVPIIRQFFWIRYFCSMYRFYSNVRRISLNIQIFYFFNRQYFNIDKSKTRYCWDWHQKWCKPYLHHIF